MTLQETENLIAEANKFIGFSYVILDAHENVIEKSKFIGTDKNQEEETSYNPLAHFQTSKGEIWNRSLSLVVAFYKNH